MGSENHRIHANTASLNCCCQSSGHRFCSSRHNKCKYSNLHEAPTSFTIGLFVILLALLANWSGFSWRRKGQEMFVGIGKRLTHPQCWVGLFQWSRCDGADNAGLCIPSKRGLENSCQLQVPIWDVSPEDEMGVKKREIETRREVGREGEEDSWNLQQSLCGIQSSHLLPSERLEMTRPNVSKLLLMNRLSFCLSSPAPLDLPVVDVLAHRRVEVEARSLPARSTRFWQEGS